MTEVQAVYTAKPNAAPAEARAALQYRRILQDLRDLNKTCEELAEQRDRALVAVNALTKKVERMREQLQQLRGEKG